MLTNYHCEKFVHKIKLKYSKQVKKDFLDEKPHVRYVAKIQDIVQKICYRA